MIEAWKFELAKSVDHSTSPKTYCDWGPPQVSITKPNVPEGSIRNLIELHSLEEATTVAKLRVARDEYNTHTATHACKCHNLMLGECEYCEKRTELKNKLSKLLMQLH